MKARERRWWQRYVPSYSRNPLRLVWHLLTTDKPAARSALWMAGAGIALAPVDLLLARGERKLYDASRGPELPVVLVCGPPRSGTTLVAQFLINHLDVSYLNNLTSLFPRSPLRANKRFGRWAKPSPGDYEAFYGKSRGLSGANDALYIWDRWLGSDRERVPEKLQAGSATRLPEFFGALEQMTGKPVVNKVNRLNTCAHLVADLLPTARFLCVQRHPLYLAQSLYVARERIVGNSAVAYGVQHEPVSDDPVKDVCLQVRFHEQHARRQREMIGEERFEIVSYERFCEDPAAFLDKHFPIGQNVRKRDLASRSTDSFAVSNDRRLPKPIFDRMAGILDDLLPEPVSRC